jgi:hypothetical protein
MYYLVKVTKAKSSRVIWLHRRSVGPYCPGLRGIQETVKSPPVSPNGRRSKKQSAPKRA